MNKQKFREENKLESEVEIKIAIVFNAVNLSRIKQKIHKETQGR